MKHAAAPTTSVKPTARVKKLGSLTKVADPDKAENATHDKPSKGLCLKSDIISNTDKMNTISSANLEFPSKFLSIAAPSVCGPGKRLKAEKLSPRRPATMKGLIAKLRFSSSDSTVATDEACKSLEKTLECEKRSGETNTYPCKSNTLFELYCDGPHNAIPRAINRRDVMIAAKADSANAFRYAARDGKLREPREFFPMAPKFQKGRTKGRFFLSAT